MGAIVARVGFGAMRLLLPEVTTELPIPDAIARFVADPPPRPTDRPSVQVVMISSLDGAITVDGRSGGLGGEGDRALFRAMRAEADVILVGAGTVRAEGYHPVALPADVVAARRAAGRRSDQPRLAIVSGRLDLDLGGELFTAPVPPILLTHAAADPARLATARDRTDVVVAGDGRVDMGLAVQALDRLADQVVCEGGPTLNAGLVDGGLLDELVLTLAPLVVGGAGLRAVERALPGRHPYALVALAADDEGYLYGRYRVPSS
jgi:riboflavin biosynthesis pyrimidine reductase